MPSPCTATSEPRCQYSPSTPAVVTSAGTTAIVRFLLAARLGLPVTHPVDCLQVPAAAGPVTVVDAKTLAAAHAAGLKVHVWTVDEPDEMRRLLDLGVDGIITNRADLLAGVLRERGMWA